MSVYVKTLKTADNTGYVLPLPAGGCSHLALGAESGECWVEPMLNQTSDPATPTNALITSVAGVVNAKSTVKLTAGKTVVLDVSAGYSADNSTARFTHLRVWGVSAGFFEALGS